MHDQTFCNWAAELRWEGLDAGAKARTLDLVGDFLGCLLGGLDTDTAQHCRRVSPAARHGVGVPGLEERWPAPEAARHMAIAGHVLELDDVIASASLHPGTVVIPAALAAGALVDAGGAALLAAVAAGYELMTRLGEAVDPAAHYADGFHPTATCGVFAAALTAAKLLGGDAGELRHAMGFAGTGASGTLSYLNDGAPTKPVQVGNAAAYGVTAALLNHQGLPGPGTVFEGRYGFFQAYAPQADPSRLSDGLGSEPLRLLATGLKPYAACRYVQPGVALLLDLQAQHGLRAQDVATVRVGVVTPALEIVGSPRERKVLPHSMADAQFSLPFCAAVALEHGAVMPAELAKSLGDASVESTAERVELVADADLDRAYPAHWGAWVTVETHAGERYELASADAKGDPANPLTAGELEAKIAALTSPKHAHAVLAAVRALPGGTVGSLVAALSGRP